MCLPTLHPWYMLILLPFLSFFRGWSLICWSAFAGLYWLHGVEMIALGEWTETYVVTLLSHIPFFIWFIVEIKIKFRSTENIVLK